MIITYYGHSCFVVESGGKKVVLDPFLSGNPSASGIIDPKKLQVDAIILTHGHGDHFGDTLDIAQRNDCPVIAIHELAGYCASKGVRAHGMNLGGAYDFDGFRVKLVPARHSSSVQDGEQMIYAGEAAGVLLTMEGRTFYHVGDTALFTDLKLIGEYHKVDAAALPIGDNYTMGPEEAVIAAEWIRPGIVIPAHFNTFPAIQQDGQSFVQACEGRGISCKELAPGESLEV